MSWWQNSIYYHIHPLGFFDCPAINPIAIPNHTLSQIQPVNRLAKIRQYYSHFQKLNIQAIYFGPLFEACTHGYDIINYYQIDRRLGTNQLFQEIVDELHHQNIKVIIDAVFNHTSRLFPAFTDLVKNQKDSSYITWYKNINFSSNTIWQDGFSYKPYSDCTELPELNLENNNVQKHIFQSIQYWFRQFAIDGLRLDVAYLLPPDLIRKIHLLTSDLNPNSVLIGEIMTPSETSLINQELLHTGTNYPLYQHIHQSFTQQDFWQLKQIFQQQKDLLLFNFLNNHDTNRIFSQLENYSDLQSAFVILLTHPGQPCIYYGDELLFDGFKKTRQDHIVRSKMINLNNLSHIQKNHLHFIQKLTSIRQNSPFINNSQIKIIHCDHQLIAYLVYKNYDSLIVIINTNPYRPLEIYHSLLKNNQYQDQYSQAVYFAENNKIKLPTGNFFILKNI